MDNDEQILEAIREQEEEEKEQRRIDKLAKLQDKTDNCQACNDAVIIDTAHKTCKLADKFMSGKTCNQLHEKVVLEEITTEDYLRKMRNVCGKDSVAKKIIQGLFDILTGNG